MQVKQIVLAERPQGMPSNKTFRTENIELPELGDAQVVLEPLYISVDPYMRGRMRDEKSYADPYEVGQPITGGVVAKVVESTSADLSKGDKVLGNLSWATKTVVNAGELRKLDDSVPLSYNLGIAGMTGLTAYFGMIDICDPKEGETVVISGAAGAVGSVAGQIAKLKRARVVGIAGTDEKVKMLKEEYGFDAGINYKTTDDMRKAIAEACPDGVDCYYDNVGGSITDAVIANINQYARIALCGQISLYNETNPTGPRLLPQILKMSVKVQGFIVKDYAKRFPEGAKQLAEWLQEDKLKFTETFVEGFDKLPEAFIGLFKGDNKGKMLVKI